MSNQRLSVSIIVPTYQRPHCIDVAVQSVLAQTYPHWELIVSDNGGDDYHFDDARIRVINSRGVPSAAYARNQAIPYVTGDLVCFLDDDDEMLPDYLATFVRVFESRPEAQMVKCQMIRRGEINKTYGTPTVMLRSCFAVPNWQPIGRQDRTYFAGIIARYWLIEDDGTLVVLPNALCRSGVDERGGLRSGAP
jgi:glycosyltransferase involved in cell wall biosynthesis